MKKTLTIITLTLLAALLMFGAVGAAPARTDPVTMQVWCLTGTTCQAIYGNHYVSVPDGAIVAVLGTISTPQLTHIQGWNEWGIYFTAWIPSSLLIPTFSAHK